MDWKEVKNLEMQHLLKEYEKNPELFEYETFVDDDQFLREFGIAIPHKTKLPRAYIKFFPHDFIVEEVMKDGTVLTADRKSNFPTISENQVEGETVYATLVKCNIATFDAVQEIARQLDCSIPQVQYAGIKDKAAITSQRISIRRVPLEKVGMVTSDFFFLKDLQTGKGVVEKGGLKGNKFTILMRTESTATEEEKGLMLKQFDFVMKNGFYNFFYLQRFGSPRLTNYSWGYRVLTGDYREAVRERLLFPGLRESKYFQELRKSLQPHFGNWEKIKEGFAPFPLICHQEHALIDYLLNNPTDYIGALNQIPDQVTLWAYGLEALLYNQILSNHIEKHEVPKELPMFLNTKPSHWAHYRTELEGLNIYPPPIQNLRHFPIRLATPLLETIDHPVIYKIEIVPEGAILEFELKKGEYATTFLSHLFNLTSGKPPETISRDNIDIKKILKIDEFAETLATFSSVIHPKVDNFIELFKGQE